MNPVPAAPSPVRLIITTIAVLAAAGALSLVALLTGLAGGGTLGQPLPTGTPVTVEISGPGRMVWASADAEVRCEPSGPYTSWSEMSARHLGMTLDGRHAVLLVTGTPPGPHTITCTAAGPAGLSIGDPPLLHDHVPRVYAMLGAGFLTVLALGLGVAAAFRRSVPHSV